MKKMSFILAALFALETSQSEITTTEKNLPYFVGNEANEQISKQR